jgi:hypothetical protein
MSEEEEKPSEAPVESEETEAQVETLEDVYSEFNVDEAAQQFQAQPVQSVPQPVTQQPDPYADIQQQESNVLRGQLDQNTQELSQLKQSMVNKEIEADIGKAVDHVSQKIDGIDRDVVDAYLNSKANRDPRFMKLWEGRNSNPAAYKRGLDALSNEMAEKFSIKQDPQLTENQRAAQQSQQSMAASNQPSADNKFADMSNEEIDKEVAAIKQSGMY